MRGSPEGAASRRLRIRARSVRAILGNAEEFDRIRLADELAAGGAGKQCGCAQRAAQNIVEALPCIEALALARLPIDAQHGNADAVQQDRDDKRAQRHRHHQLE
jgi:hypothetical protein